MGSTVGASKMVTAGVMNVSLLWATVMSAAIFCAPGFAEVRYYLTDVSKPPEAPLIVLPLFTPDSGSPYGVALYVANDTEKPVVIHWEQSSLLSAGRRAYRVVVEGVRYVDRMDPVPPTFLPPKSRISTSIYPAELIYYSESLGEWRHLPIPVVAGSELGLFLTWEVGEERFSGEWRWKVLREELQSSEEPQLSTQTPLAATTPTPEKREASPEVPKWTLNLSLIQVWPFLRLFPWAFEEMSEIPPVLPLLRVGWLRWDDSKPANSERGFHIGFGVWFRYFGTSEAQSGKPLWYWGWGTVALLVPYIEAGVAWRIGPPTSSTMLHLGLWLIYPYIELSHRF